MILELVSHYLTLQSQMQIHQVVMFSFKRQSHQSQIHYLLVSTMLLSSSLAHFQMRMDHHLSLAQRLQRSSLVIMVLWSHDDDDLEVVQSFVWLQPLLLSQNSIHHHLHHRNDLQAWAQEGLKVYPIQKDQRLMVSHNFNRNLFKVLIHCKYHRIRRNNPLLDQKHLWLY